MKGMDRDGAKERGRNEEKDEGELRGRGLEPRGSLETKTIIKLVDALCNIDPESIGRVC